MPSASSPPGPRTRTVGSGREDFGTGTLTERWNGAAWTVVPSPDTLHIDDVLNAVADVSPSNAWAVGLVKTTGVKTGSPLIVHWSGTSWQTVASPAAVSGKLRAVSADSASDLWAVGDDGRGHAIAFHSNGTSWISATLPAIGIDNLQGVTTPNSANDNSLNGLAALASASAFSVSRERRAGIR